MCRADLRGFPSVCRVLERVDGPQRIEDLLGSDSSPLPRLGVLCLTIDDKISALLPPLRVGGGVLVVAKMAGERPRLGDDLAAGDVIHVLNGAEIKDVASLQTQLDALSAHSPLVLQLYRSRARKVVVGQTDHTRNSSPDLRCLNR